MGDGAARHSSALRAVQIRAASWPIILKIEFWNNFYLLTASLYLPLLEFVRMIFKGHKYLSVALIEVAPDHLIQLLAELSVHLRLAHESLEHEKESLENFDVLYTTSEAKTIVELTANVIKSIIDSKAEVVTFIALRDPAIIVNSWLF